MINDDVGIAVNEAYQHIIDSKRFLKVNDILNATAHAKKAFIQSERAFYYPSMLALLYFPDDQKWVLQFREENFKGKKFVIFLLQIRHLHSIVLTDHDTSCTIDEDYLVLLFQKQ